MQRHLFICADPDDEEIAPPTCPFCDEVDSLDTPEHIVGFCPAFARLRWEIFGHWELKPPFGELKISQLMSFMAATKYAPLQWKQKPQDEQETPSQAANLLTTHTSKKK